MTNDQGCCTPNEHPPGDHWWLEPEFYADLPECTRCGAKAGEPCWDTRRKVKPARMIDIHREGGRTKS